ncbi:uncharacterized protein K452DRAFT_79758 [Aplosporella prunicola CBS 121167]|uniref:DUF7728 domain-containing protein n=1 Tax=Aplosporella prunicola CBS 121167 TaxID=1176127 RepID=A0A6A6B713_9PEZI|nr:uncharacterized protein K452DRAFT_79758 [Aplosporella prunicola CBS 121167]KAF2139024.1 hypothetical protein K452DRAFT_79758 [Aplosporella prunicola CBS 121167]
MKYSALGLGAAALIAPSSAFLIPSTADGVTGPFADQELSLVDPQNQLLTLDCNNCAFAGSADEDDDSVWVQGIENALLLNFSVVDGYSVELNGARLYPPTDLPQPIPVTQVRSDVSLTDIRANAAKYGEHPLRISGYALEIDPSVSSSEGAELIPMTFQIASLEGRPVDVSALDVKLMKLPDGEIQILPVTAAAPLTSIEPPQQDDEACRDWPVLCKWRSIISDRIQDMKTSIEKGIPKGCMKGHHHGDMPHHPPAPEDMEPAADDERPHDHHHGPHHGPHGIMRHHRDGPIAHFFGVLGRIMVPIFIGIAFGALTYATGWLVGCVVAYIWLRVQARRNGGYNRIALDEEEVLAKEVGAVEIPAEEPPLYSEKEVVPEPEAEAEQREQH